MAAAITFPLTWGWFTFTASSATGPGYEMRLWGIKLFGFSSSSLLGWAMFHGLDLAAVLVIGGVGYFLWRRYHDRAATTGQRFAYDFLPLLALLTVSVTGLRTGIRRSAPPADTGTLASGTAAQARARAPTTNPSARRCSPAG